MDEEDREIVAAERDASPERFEEYDDPRGNFRQQYSRLQPDQREALSRTVTQGGSSASSSASSSSSVRVEEIAAAPTRALSRTQTETDRINSRMERSATALDRIETHRTQHSTTVGASLKSRQTTKPLPNFGAGKPFPPPLPAKEEYVVEFDGEDDPLYSQNWPFKKKLYLGAIVAFFSLSATFGSSVFSAASRPVSMEFGVSMEVTTLATSLFVLGYAFGPIAWAPISELYGRRPPLLISSFGFSIFAIAVAVAKDLQTIMICRFFCGLMGSCPLATVAAVFADMFNNKQRGLAVAIFGMTVFVGPLCAPFISGFIVISSLGWRWTEYISAIMGFLSFGLIVLFFEETYPPVVLVSKASELRRRTKNWGIHAKQEEIEVDLKELLSKNVSRPLRILFTEPIVLLVSIYLSFIYGLLYLFLTAYALVFQQVYGMNPGVGGLPYFGMVIGELIAFAVVVITNPSYERKLEANNNIPVPEWRLPICIAGGPIFAIGLFWFGWTGYSGDIPWIVPTLSGLCTGFGLFAIFISLLNYLVDAYLMFAASAIAANTFMRSLAGAAFPLFATYMFNGMGIQYAATLLGAVAAVLVPMPILFYVFGKRIRAKSKIAPAIDIAAEKKKKQDLESGSDSDEKKADGEAEKEAKKDDKSEKQA